MSAAALLRVVSFGVAVAIDDIVQNAHLFNPRARRTMDLKPAVEALFEELDAARVEYVLVGGVALLSYVEGRNTQDIDIIVRTEHLDRLPWNAEIQDRDFGRASFRGVHVDLLLRTNPLFEYVASAEASEGDFQGRRIRVATRAGLLLLKLYALPSLYRRGNLARAALYETDILMLHQGVDVDDEAVLTTLSKHVAPHDLAELRRILIEQKSRKRFQ